MAIVVRNDDLELAVEAEAPVASAVGEVWRVRYRIDSRVWQFDTSTVSWDGRRLVLNHGEQAHAVEHDRADRLTVQAPAAMARFPFVQATATESADMVPTDWFELVRGVVTEVSDSSLQIRSRLRVQVGERVLVVFALTPLAAGEANDAAHRGHVVAHVGRVKHRQALGEEMVMTVDLTDLADRQIDELLRLARAVAPGAGTPAGARTIQGV